mmetsp:Transcript_16188/g.33737  ORF Transcript_16188/g.33737 Transcript_16188/m.33737 type:complete len:184 (+) Transcript_16188:75-626(+)
MLDRRRLLRIEALADEVLRTQEDLVHLDREQNARREALGSFRRGEAKGGTQWVATEGQFLRLPSGTVRDWLHERQEGTKEEVAAGRARLKGQTQTLLEEHPGATDLSPGVWELLLQEHRQQPGRSTEGGATKAQEPQPRPGPEARPGRGRGGPGQEDRGKKDRLDYSRFDHIDDSGSDIDGGG